MVRTTTAFGTSAMGTLAARCAGTPGAGDAELSLKGSIRVGQQDGRDQRCRLSSWHEQRHGP